VTTGILSNMGDAMEAGIRARFPWLAAFRHATFSHRVGIVKPDEGIYLHAIAGIGESAETTLFIDDRIENVEAARTVGLYAIQYTSHEDFAREFQNGNFAGLPLPTAAVASRTP